MKKTLKIIVKKTPLYPLYKYFADRRSQQQAYRKFWEWTEEDQKRMNFYRQFVGPGDKVFDVGANLGNRAKIFSRLGAFVVAVEPQTDCANYLRSVFRNTPNFHLVKKALGASEGQLEMHINEDHSMISSLSPEWIRSVTESGRFKNKWNRRETVQVDTLDHLIAEQGAPAFVKIDVEGFEDQVVSGLSVLVGALSMEFTHEFMESAFKCIEHLCGIADCRFQISLGESMDFALPNWVPADEIKKTLSVIAPKSWGDIYARFKIP
jgi:FkbM family methyltransferase